MAWFAFLTLKETHRNIYILVIWQHTCTECVIIYLTINDILSLYYWLDGCKEKSILPGGCLYQTPSHPVILSGQHTNSSQYPPDGTLERWNLVNKSYHFKFSNSNKHLLTYYCNTAVTAGITKFAMWDYLFTITVIFPMTLEITYFSKLVNKLWKECKHTELLHSSPQLASVLLFF